MPQASQWQINNFLESRSSNAFKNLLVIADPLLQLGHLYEVRLYYFSYVKLPVTMARSDWGMILETD